MWRITTMVAKHYIHASKMKKHRFIKNKDVECIVKTNVEKMTLIPRTHVTHGMHDFNKISDAWMCGSNNVQM
jgi:hypothetical protein